MISVFLKYSMAVYVVTLCAVSNASGDVEGKNKSVACAGCHGENGISLSGEFPNLAGQKKTYLSKQLKDFKRGTRKDPTMFAMASMLNDSDIELIAAYFSNLPRKKEVSIKSNTVNSVPTTDSANSTEFPETTYISMKKSGTVETFPKQVTWKGGDNMLYNAVTPDGRKVLATSPSSNSVYVFDAENGRQLCVIKVGKAPKGVKVSPDGAVAYVSNQGSANISVIDLEKLKVIDTIKVGEGPHNARFTKDGSLAYVTLQGGAGIGVVDTKSRTQIKIISVPGITGPHNIDLSYDEKTAYVRDFVHHVAVLDLKTGKVKKVITVGNGHGGIDVTPDGKYAATAAIGDHFISIINTNTLEVKNINVGLGPHGIRASKNSHWLYVTLTKENAVVVVNLKTLKVAKKISVGQFPFWVAVKGNP